MAVIELQCGYLSIWLIANPDTSFTTCRALSSILIKVGAINKMTNYESRKNELLIDAKSLKRYPLYFISIVIIFLSIWSIVDIPKQTETLSLGNDEVSSNIIVEYSCSSKSSAWTFIAYLWQGLILSCTGVLTFQSSIVIKEFNESKSLSWLIYSQFLFLIFRVATVFVTNRGWISRSIQMPLVGIVLCGDMLTGTFIYIGSKLKSMTVVEQQRAFGSSMYTRNIERRKSLLLESMKEEERRGSLSSRNSASSRFSFRGLFSSFRSSNSNRSGTFSSSFLQRISFNNNSSLKGSLKRKLKFSDEEPISTSS